MDRYEKSALNRDKATDLIAAWGIPVVHARYRETGNWYARLTRFPAALLDAHGYVLFESEEELKSCSFVHVKKQISVPRGISAIPSYVRMSEPESAVLTEEIAHPEDFWEGAVKRVTVNAFERDPKARKACIDHFGAACIVCGFDFFAIYGDVGKGFIHVHHTRPLSDVREGYAVDPKKDLVPVCPNCHAILHRGKTPPTIGDVQRFLKKDRSDPKESNFALCTRGSTSNLPIEPRA